LEVRPVLLAFRGIPKVQSQLISSPLLQLFRSLIFRLSKMAVNLGNNADTTGAYYGYPGIPEEWREKIAKRKLIESFSIVQKCLHGLVVEKNTVSI